VSDKALLFVAGYLVIAFILGVLIGKSIKWGQRCIHVWEDKGYGGAGWTLKVCKLCGKREIDS
jgi:hypothetical protein